jgi:ABC-type transport system involved in multi-copper enzyme maturation permease subunit
MLDRLLANASINLKFFRRNRLVLAMALVFACVTLLYVTGSLLFGSTTGRFEIVSTIFLQLSYFTSVFTAGLGLLLVSSQVRGRSIKLVVTKPCSPDVWLTSAFASAIGVAALLHAATLVIALGLSLAWGLPVQSGFLFVAIVSFLRSVIILGYLVLLTMLFHPVVAVLCAIIFTESTFYGLRFETLAAIKATGGNILLPLFEKASYVVYMLLPMTSPYEQEQGEILQTFRVSTAQWAMCFYSLAYAATLTLVFYFLALRLLRRKNLM